MSLSYADVVKRAEANKPSHITGYSATPYDIKLGNKAAFFKKCINKYFYKIINGTHYVCYDIPTPQGFIKMSTDTYGAYLCPDENYEFSRHMFYNLEFNHKDILQLEYIIDKLCLVFALGYVSPDKFIKMIYLPNKKYKYLCVLKRLVPVFAYIRDYMYTKDPDIYGINLPTEILKLIQSYILPLSLPPTFDNNFTIGLANYLRWLYYWPCKRIRENWVNIEFFGGRFVDIFHGERGKHIDMKQYTNAICKFINEIGFKYCCWCSLQIINPKCRCKGHLPQEDLVEEYCSKSTGCLCSAYSVVGHELCYFMQ